MKKGIPVLFLHQSSKYRLYSNYMKWVIFLSYLSPVKGHLQIVPHLCTVYELIWHNILNPIDKIHTMSVFLIKDSELRSSNNKLIILSTWKLK